MNIGIVHTNFTRGGGMEAYLLSLIAGFQHQGDGVTVYACKVDRQLAREMGCRVRRIRPFLPRKAREFRFLDRCDRLPLRQDHDLSLGMARTESVHVNVCGGVHAETLHHIRRTALLRHLYDRIELYFERKMFHKVPHVMAHSAAVKREILAHYAITPAKIKVVYPPIDTGRFQAPDGDARARARDSLGIDDRRVTLLFVSCGHQRKGLDELLQAFSALDPACYQLLIAGSKVPKSHPSNVRFLGYCTNLAPVYCAVDYTILPAHYEPFGLVVAESMQCGTPVIATTRVGATELLANEPAILLEDNQPSTIIAAVERLEPGVRVPSGFASRHALDIDQHITAIKTQFC
ncbi:MAG: glycosyltransferase family 4 protein [Desulfobulbus sp.]